MVNQLNPSDEGILRRARQIQLLLTDCDGVLTDSGVYYSAEGEVLRRFSVRDGMGVERLRSIAGVDVGLISGEQARAISQRAAKLAITELHLGIKDKLSTFNAILQARGLTPTEVAYIGDDTNDVPVLVQVGFSACPADAISLARQVVHYISPYKGGYGAFRDIAELIIAAKNS